MVYFEAATAWPLLTEAPPTLAGQGLRALLKHKCRYALQVYSDAGVSPMLMQTEGRASV